MDGKKEESSGGVRECVFRCGIWQDGLPNPMGNLSLSERERERDVGREERRGGKRSGERRKERRERGRQREREGEVHRIERIGCGGLGKDR